MDGEWTDLSLKNIHSLWDNPPPPWIEKYFDLPQKPKIPKFQLPLT